MGVTELSAGRLCQFHLSHGKFESMFALARGVLGQISNWGSERLDEIRAVHSKTGHAARCNALLRFSDASGLGAEEVLQA